MAKILNFSSVELLSGLPVDGVLAPVECNNAPVEPDKQEGFENWKRTTGSLF